MPAKIQESTPVKKALTGLGRAAFWVAGSALFGSVALVLWNRRALKSMREAVDAPVNSPRPRDDDGIY